MEGGRERQQDRHRQEEDAEADCLIAGGEEKEADAEEQAEAGEGFVRVDRQRVVRGGEHFDHGDEVDEDGSVGGGDGDVSPARLVVKGCGQHRERGERVEANRDSEPKERHGGQRADERRGFQYIGLRVGLERFARESSIA